METKLREAIIEYIQKPKALKYNKNVLTTDDRREFRLRCRQIKLEGTTLTMNGKIIPTWEDVYGMLEP